MSIRTRLAKLIPADYNVGSGNLAKLVDGLAYALDWLVTRVEDVRMGWHIANADEGVLRVYLREHGIPWLDDDNGDPEDIEYIRRVVFALYASQHSKGRYGDIVDIMQTLTDDQFSTIQPAYPNGIRALFLDTNLTISRVKLLVKLVESGLPLGAGFDAQWANDEFFAFDEQTQPPYDAILSGLAVPVFAEYTGQSYTPAPYIESYIKQLEN